MSGIPTAPLGPIAGLALRFPSVAGAALGAGSFVKRHWKVFAGAALAVALGFATVHYLDNRDAAKFEEGFSTAETQYRTALAQADARADADQHALDLVTQRFGFLAAKREADVTTIIKPQLERVTREVVQNPVYRTCALTDGVFDAANAAAAAVNTSIDASAPRVDR